MNLARYHLFTKILYILLSESSTSFHPNKVFYCMHLVITFYTFVSWFIVFFFHLFYFVVELCLFLNFVFCFISSMFSVALGDML